MKPHAVLSVPSLKSPVTSLYTKGGSPKEVAGKLKRMNSLDLHHENSGEK